jgi:orotidine-5'-phosphate decarboxylase
MRRAARLILALDVDSFSQARYFVNQLYPEIKIFKVGIQLFVACGPRIVEFIRRKGAEVFLDLKFFDIPNSVANAVRQAVRLKVKMLTLHILGGAEMLQAAVAAANTQSRRLKVRRPLLMGVTVLTSREAASGDVLALAKLAMASGLDGVVCSVREAGLLRRKIRKNFYLVTPGIRPAGAQCTDQKRIATPQEAIKAGSDFLVVGRPLLEAKEPLGVIKALKAKDGPKGSAGAN